MKKFFLINIEEGTLNESDLLLHLNKNKNFLYHWTYLKQSHYQKK